MNHASDLQDSRHRAATTGAATPEDQAQATAAVNTLIDAVIAR